MKTKLQLLVIYVIFLVMIGFGVFKLEKGFYLEIPKRVEISDTTNYYLTTKSIVEDKDLNLINQINNFLKGEEWKEKYQLNDGRNTEEWMNIHIAASLNKKNELVSLQSIGYSLILVPMYYLGSLINLGLEFVLLMNILMTAGTMVICTELCNRIIKNRKKSILITLSFILIIPLLPYTFRLWSEVSITFILILIVLIIKKPNKKELFLIGLLSGFLIYIKPFNIIYSSIIQLYILKTQKKKYYSIIPFLLVIMTIPFYNYELYGHPMKNAYNNFIFITSEDLVKLVESPEKAVISDYLPVHFTKDPRLIIQNFIGIFLGKYKGILQFYPIFVMIILNTLKEFKEKINYPKNKKIDYYALIKKTDPYHTLIISIIILQIIGICFLSYAGGITPFTSRFLIPLTPLLIIPYTKLIQVISKNKVQKRIFLLLYLSTLIMNVIIVRDQQIFYIIGGFENSEKKDFFPHLEYLPQTYKTSLRIMFTHFLKHQSYVINYRINEAIEEGLELRE